MMDEKVEILISMMAISLAVTIAFFGVEIFGNPFLFLKAFFVFFFAVGVGFVFHELGHRTVARYFGAYARYVMWPKGLLLALLFSFLGFVFAAPGAVYIYAPRHLSREENGLISLAGPLVNLLLFFFFYITSFFLYFPIKGINAFYLAAKINAFLAFFNFLPFFPLDGVKVFFWDRKIWGMAVVLAFLCLLA